MAINREDPDVQELIAEVTAALSAKNKELLTELKAAKAKAKGAEIDPEEYARLQSEVESLQDKLSAAERKSKSEVEKLSKSLGEKDSALSAYLVDAGISEALAKGGVAPQFVKPLQALFKSQAQLKAEGGAYSAVIGDKAVSEAINAYLGSDEGKHFVSAPANAGGGAAGSAHGGGSKRFADMSTEERTALYRRDPKAYEAAKAAA